MWVYMLDLTVHLFSYLGVRDEIGKFHDENCTLADGHFCTVLDKFCGGTSFLSGA